MASKYGIDFNEDNFNTLLTVINSSETNYNEYLLNSLEEESKFYTIYSQKLQI